MHYGILQFIMEYSVKNTCVVVSAYLQLSQLECAYDALKCSLCR